MDNNQTPQARRPIITLKLSNLHTNLGATHSKAESKDLINVSYLRNRKGELDRLALVLQYEPKNNEPAREETLRYNSDELTREAYVLLKDAVKRNVEKAATRNTFNVATNPETPAVMPSSKVQTAARPANPDPHYWEGLKRFLG